ncbi:hypothetical protein [Aestuariicoccus sp. MJ-SS9]|uniref:hypothetical protein n=1 Tax=Aestuariicoccus sp. MJ-SS9 TaxID=3079855 RepID=UPI00290D5343|nr:hypothetical protein [Aestuariicoccus sp. MJ-SS9]MDU8913911.1 hypothetical protein [Aestuariicoccus sp. MJ-SS9]
MTDCTLVDGVLPEGCVQPNAGTAVTMPTGENTELEQFQTDLGDEGFVISVDAVEPGADPVFLEGSRESFNEYRRVDRILDNLGVEVRYDGLYVNPVLAIATADLRRTYTAGETVTFRASSNYPAFISRAEIRIADADRPGRVLAVVPVAPNGTANWVMPSGGPDELTYALRVYDRSGRYDETRSLSLARSGTRLPGPELTGPIIAAGENEDMTRRRTIRVNGGAITVQSDGLSPGTRVTVMGEAVPVDATGAFVVQRIVPQGYQTVRVGVGARTIDKEVEIPESDWFYVGAADITIGKEEDETYTIGRVSGYAKGRTQSGLDITAAVDTREGDLDRIFRDIFAKEPVDQLRSIRDQDVYLTFGDDSTTIDGAPTSGKLYLKVQKDRSHLLWGDFKVTEQGMNLVRSDRTLYGAQVHYESPAQTQDGQPRFRFTAYAANPDRLAQRDVLEATGGSAYFLSRQGILTGSATLYVQVRDPVTGIVISQRALVEGQDYEINYFQGIVLLSQPLSQSAGTGYIGDSPFGDNDVVLVAQYEYVPTFGDVDGTSAGLRAESWVTDQVRVGLSAQTESTGTADNKLVGADFLWRRSDLTYANLEVARSEGPGFGASNSINGGLDFDPFVVGTSGVEGKRAMAYHFEARADLAELTEGRAEGFVAAYYDHKEEGFVSADYDIADTQTAWGISSEIQLSPATKLLLAHEDFDTENGNNRTDTHIGLSMQINQQWAAEIAATYTDRDDPSALPEYNGTRTDVGVRLTYSPNDNASYWIFGQHTVDRTGGLPANDRFGIGARAKLTDRLTFEGEVSDGDLGEGGYANLIYQNDANSQYHVGYRLDPMRSFNDSGFSGSDGGVWVLGAQTQISDDVRVLAENTYDLAGDKPSLNSTFGVTYTPGDLWTYEMGLIYGESKNPTSGTLRREGVTLGFSYDDGAQFQAGLRGEYRREDSDTDPALDRDTWGLTGYARYKISEETRILANIDALVSESDQSSFRDGHYVEANLGLAHRPILDDRLNFLFRYTYLNDQPGPDQVNVAGDLDGPEQISHIVSADVSYDLNRQFTLGAKIGYRKAEVADRGTDDFTSNTATLGILRLDYHVVHNWDITGEARVMKFKEAGVTEKGYLLGVWRHFGNNVKVGAGYQFGDISDDLRLIEGKKEGPFLNIVAKF